MSNQSSLETSIGVCTLFRSTITSGFGPNAVSTLIRKDTGKLLVTNTGITVLNSIAVSHPMGKMIINAVNSHYNANGDHTKAFVLLLHSILTELVQMDINDLSPLQMLLVLPEVKRLLLNTILPDLLSQAKIICVIDSNKDSIVEVVKGLVFTALRGKLPIRSLTHITETIMNLILYNLKSVVDLPAIIRELVEDTESVLIDCAGYPISQSKVISGIVIKREMNKFHEDKTGGKISFIIFDTEVDKTEKESTVVDLISQATLSDNQESKTEQVPGVLDNMLEWKTKSTGLFVDSLASRGVNLVLCTERASEMLINHFKRVKISTIQYVPDEDIKWLSGYCGISVIHEIRDLTTDHVFIGQAEKLNPIIVDSRSGIYLENLEIVSNTGRFGGQSLLSNKMLICGPSAGICEQVSFAVAGVFKVLNSWISSNCYISLKCPDADNEEHNVLSQSEAVDKGCIDNQQISTDHSHCVSITEGASFELELYKAINEILKKNYGQEFKLTVKSVLEIIQRSLLSIPVCLMQNSYAKDAAKWSRLRIEHAISTEKELIGLDARSGSIMISGEENVHTCGLVCESLFGKVNLIMDVMDLLYHILKVDKFVSVSGKVEKS